MGFKVHEPGDLVGLANAPAIAFTFDPWHALIMVRADLDQGHRRVDGTAEEAKVIKTHVAFSADRFIVRHPGTDPLWGLMVPKKAAATSGTSSPYSRAASPRRRTRKSWPSSSVGRAARDGGSSGEGGRRALWCRPRRVPKPDREKRQ